MNGALSRVVRDVSRLKAVSAPVLDPAGPEAARIVEELWSLVSDVPCMGMAAIQIGHEKRIFLGAVPGSLKAIHRIGEKPNPYPENTPSVLKYGVYINPEIVAHTTSMEYSVESCMSLPGQYCFVPRRTDIKIRYQTLGSKDTRYARLSGSYARVFQHELDHLDGILMTDRHVDPTTVIKSKKDLNILEMEIAMLQDEYKKGLRPA